MKTTQRTLTIKTEQSMKRYSFRVWELLSDAYRKIKGGLNYESIDDLIYSSSQWKLIVKDGM